MTLVLRSQRERRGCPRRLLLCSGDAGALTSLPELRISGGWGSRPRLPQPFLSGSVERLDVTLQDFSIGGKGSASNSATAAQHRRDRRAGRVRGAGTSRRRRAAVPATRRWGGSCDSRSCSSCDVLRLVAPRSVRRLLVRGGELAQPVFESRLGDPRVVAGEKGALAQFCAEVAAWGSAIAVRRFFSRHGRREAGDLLVLRRGRGLLVYTRASCTRTRAHMGSVRICHSWMAHPWPG